MLAGQA